MESSLAKRISNLVEIPRLGDYWVLAATAFLILTAWMPPTGIWSDGEDHYLWLAQQWRSAPGVPDGTALLGGMPHAYAFLGIASTALAWFGETTGQMVLRVLVVVVYSLAIARLARVLGLRAIELALGLMGFLLLDQQLFGGEWLFRAVEPKVFAYAAIMLGIGAWVERRFYACAAWMAIATHFHVLAGVQWTGFLVLAALLDLRRIQPLLGPGAVFVLLALPGLAYVAWRYHGAGEVLPGSPDSSWIISHYRMPHHSALWDDRKIVSQSLPGILATVPIALAGWFYSRALAGNAAKLGVLCAVVSGWLIAALLITAVDQSGTLGATTPFRPTSLLLLLTLILLLVALRQCAGPNPGLLLIPAFAIAAAIFVAQAALRGYWWPRGAEERMRVQQAEIWEYARAQTPPSAVFIVDPELEPDFRSFERRTGRAMLVLWKFIPSTAPDVHEWYRRMRFQERLYETGCKTPPSYRIDYAIASADEAELFEDCTQTVVATDQLVLLRFTR